MSGFLPVSLETPRLRIRCLTPDDVPAQFAIYSDVAAMRFWSCCAWNDLQQARDQVESSLRDYAAGSGLRLAVALQATGAVIGNVSLFGMDMANRRCSLGYILLQSRQGEGYMTEALIALMDYAFDRLDLNRIEADVDPRNTGSIRLLERLGFQREGFLPERWIVQGEVCDTALFGLLKKHWAGEGQALR